MPVSRPSWPCHTPRLHWAAVPVAVALLASWPWAHAESAAEVRLARYSTATAQPDPAQIDPFEAIVHVNLPRGAVRTVGEAIDYLLLRTGYRLLLPQENDQAAALLALPLPEVHRRLGPYTVRTALEVLLGRPFVLSVDPARRVVSYRAEPMSGQAMPQVAGTDSATAASRSTRSRP